MIQKTFKYRIYPNKTQQEMLNQHFGCVRYIYNKALETKIKEYETTGKTLSCFNLINGLLKEEKQENEWLTNTYSQCLQMSIRNLDNAFTKFFREKKGFPKFKSKHKSRSSCQFPQHVKIDFKKSKIKLPKIGWINLKLSRTFCGKMKTVTVYKTSTGKYFVSILVETKGNTSIKPKIQDENSISIDLGIKYFIIDSKGNKIDNPKHLKKSLDRLKILQKRASKKNKGGLRRRKLMKKVARLHEKIKNQRHDFLHQVSTKLISENQTIVLENLNVSGMIRNHCLAQSIQDCSWSTFVNYLRYKAEWYGINIIQIGRFEPSSKTCSSCGTVKQDLTLKDREWTCLECGTTHDRDINAAINIKKFGLLDKNISGPGRPVELQSVNTSTLVE